MPAYPINANFAITSNGVAAANFTASDAIGVALNVNNGCSIGAALHGLLAANLAASTVMGGRTALDYYFVQAFIDGLVDDPLPVLAYLLVCEAASTCNHQNRIGEVIEQVSWLAYLLLDEVYGLRKMPLDRPADDQMAELKAQIASARAAAGLDALPATAPVPFWLNY